MSNIDSVTKEIEKVLGNYLDDKCDYREVIFGWPEANQSLKMPALSVIAGDPDHQVFPPFYHSKGSVSNHRSSVNYITGQNNWNMQLDLWCKTKEERHDRFDDLYQACNSQMIAGHAGLFLTLENYHGIIASYLFAGYDFMDGDTESQRKEWRARISILANCFVVSTDKQYIITEEPELDFEISDESL